MNKMQRNLINANYAFIRFDVMLSLLFVTAPSKSVHAKINHYYVFFFFAVFTAQRYEKLALSSGAAGGVVI